MSQPSDLLAALAPVVAALVELDVRYYVGGSVASSYHGAARSTMDVDLVAELTNELVKDFLSRLGDQYYASEPAIRDAIQRTSCFNLIHLDTSFKVDIFINQGRPFDESCLRRATNASLGNSPQKFRFATAEDSILSKLEWYELGNRTSERQWDDVTRVLQMTEGSIDVVYLKQMATELELEHLLAQLFKEVG